jgi:hypothetical protein
VCELLPEGASRQSSRTELFFEDLEKLPGEEVARIQEWLMEKVDGFSSKLKAEAKELEQEVCVWGICAHALMTNGENGVCHLVLDWVKKSVVA